MRYKYKKQVALLLRILPAVYRLREFAIHGGTAINMFHKNMPRYSVDIDVTYIPIEDRRTNFDKINAGLTDIKQDIERSIPGITVKHRPDILKLLCAFCEATVKIEVNGTKRGTIGEVVDLPLCEKAQAEFSMGCKARTASFSQLYGGKIAAALSRQHPRDLFDCKYMELETFADVKDGFMLCLLSSEKPIVELLQPNEINQADAMENQFQGMSDIPFSYDDYDSTRKALMEMVYENLTETDKEFILSFEKGCPEWSKCSAGDLSGYPSVQWKLLNIDKLKKANAKKLEQSTDKLRRFLESI